LSQSYSLAHKYKFIVGAVEYLVTLVVKLGQVLGKVSGKKGFI